MNHEWLSSLAELRDGDIPCVLITVMEAKGSTPREAGTKMVATADRQFGTIGGGNLEFQAIDEARKLLAVAATSAKIKDYPLGPALAQCCGGAVTVFLEPFIPSRKTVLLFGAGHVGKEVVERAARIQDHADLGVDVTVRSDEVEVDRLRQPGAALQGKRVIGCPISALGVRVGDRADQVVDREQDPLEK